MSFSHRFGVGAGDSYEDPWIPECCDDCDKTHEECKGSDPNCKTYREYVGAPEREEKPMNEDWFLDLMWEREI